MHRGNSCDILADTSQFKAAEYAKKFEFSTNDTFVILSSERFTEIDQMIADEVKRIKKLFFFARTKMDNAMRDQKRKLKRKFNASKHLTISERTVGVP